MRVSYTRLTADAVSTTVMLLSPFLIFIGAVLLNASFITSLIDERVSYFKHQVRIRTEKDRMCRHITQNYQFNKCGRPAEDGLPASLSAHFALINQPSM